MKNNLLLEKIIVLQNKYRELLINLIPYMESDVVSIALDEIVVFWNENLELIRIFLNSYVAQTESFVFTASTYMDIEDKENYPFMLLGGMHIMDDPLGKYCEICKRMKEKQVTGGLLEQIILTTKDNIKIIEQCKEEIIVLPLRLFNQHPEDSRVFQIGEKAFVSLFKDISSIKEYFERCSTFDDIVLHAREDIGNIILFDEGDNKDMPLEDRFKQSIPNIPHLIEGEFSEGELFFQMVFGGIQQAVDVILSCIEYRVIPLIRYLVVFNYFLLLMDNFRDIEMGVQIRYKAYIANLVYRVCDKDKLCHKGFKRFVDVIKAERFWEEMLAELETTVNSKELFNVSTLMPIIEKRLNNLYEKI